MSVQKQESRGSASLGIVLSTFGGAVFLLTFYNLVSYVGARSAVEEAARKVARCLSPSDPECVTSSTDSNLVPDISTEWFGYPTASQEKRIETELYTYTARMFSQPYSARFTTYEINRYTPRVAWNLRKAEVTRFLGLLNSWANLRADVYVYRKRDIGGVTQRERCLFPNWIELPSTFQFNTPADYFDTRWCSTVQAADLEACGLGDSQGWVNDSDSGSRSSSYCAFGLPDSSNPALNPWLQLGGTPVCDGEVSGAPENQALPQGQAALIQALGAANPGETNKPFPVTAQRQFVVVDVVTCDPAQVRSALQARIQDTDDLKSFFSTVNQLNTPVPDPQYASHTDRNAYLSTINGAVTAPFLAGYDWTYFEWVRTVGSTTGSPVSPPPGGYDPDRLDATRNFPGLPIGERRLTRRLCDWQELRPGAPLPWPADLGAQANAYTTGGEYLSNFPSARVTLIDPSCEKSALEPQRQPAPFVCGERVTAGEEDSFDDCVGWASQKINEETKYKAELNSLLALNKKYRTGASALPGLAKASDFGTEISPAWGEPLDSNWEFSWNRLDSDGSAVPEAALRAVAGETSTGQGPKVYKTQAGYKEPARDVFPSLIAATVGQAQGGSGWAEFLTSFEVVAGEEREEVISGVWPFLQNDSGQATPQPRPYLGQKGYEHGFDYNLDCKTDYDCQGKSYDSLESALREFAALQPGIGAVAKDKQVVFDWEESFSHTEQRIVRGDSGYPACTQSKVECRPPERADATLVGSSTELPEACKDGTYQACFSKASLSERFAPEYETKVDLVKAKAKALQELKRILPYVKDCEPESAPGCSEVVINTESPEEVLIEVRMSVPLTSPLKEILQKSSIIVSHTKREAMELADMNQ